MSAFRIELAFSFVSSSNDHLGACHSPSDYLILNLRTMTPCCGSILISSERCTSIPLRFTAGRGGRRRRTKERLQITSEVGNGEIGEVGPSQKRCQPDLKAVTEAKSIGPAGWVP
jgi:hypothetical protein